LPFYVVTQLANELIDRLRAGYLYLVVVEPLDFNLSAYGLFDGAQVGFVDNNPPIGLDA